MLTMEERKQRIAKIRLLPAKAGDAVKGLNDAQLDTPFRSGAWSIRQVVHHLADSHMNAFIRMKLLLTEENPTIKTYEQDAWAALHDSARLPVDSSMLVLRGLHERWVSLMESLPPQAWERTGMHPERGIITVDDLLVIYSDHGESHVASVVKARKEKGW
jgi:hypothetical protein